MSFLSMYKHISYLRNNHHLLNHDFYNNYHSLLNRYDIYHQNHNNTHKFSNYFGKYPYSLRQYNQYKYPFLNSCDHLYPDTIFPLHTFHYYIYIQKDN